jgi:hypothetical protein
MAVVTGLFLVTLAVYRLFGMFGWLGVEPPRASISAYYYHDDTGFPMKDVFVGALAAIGASLIAYQGYTRAENWALNAAGSFLLVVVAWPMNRWPTFIQNTSAILFFLCLAGVSQFQSRSTHDAVTDRKRKGIYLAVYMATGVLMVALPLSALALSLLLGLADWVYLLEWTGVFAFLTYWVVKSHELYYTQLETQGRPAVLEAKQVQKEVMRSAETA